jgi:hypothetical protein
MSLNSPWPGIIKLFPARGSSDIPAGDGIKHFQKQYCILPILYSLNLKNLILLKKKDQL